MRAATFRHGIHPADEKTWASAQKIMKIPTPKDLFVALQQHIGRTPVPLVKKGDTVKKGQLLASSDEFISANVHAPAAGKVKSVDTFRLPSGQQSKMIHIITDGDMDETEYLKSVENWEKAGVKELLHIIKNAGIVGLGGAAFPSHVKLSPPPDKKIDTLILNGCECEPYLTADHAVMLNEAKAVITGCRILMKILGVDRAVIGIENNKMDAVEALEKQNNDPRIEILPLAVKYPQGAEKMLIDATLGRQVPPGKLPMDSGVVVQNVATAAAVKEAVIDGIPLTERIITLAGDGFEKPGNYRTLIGTPISFLLEQAGYQAPGNSLLFMGGPMMGKALTDLNVPMVKAGSGIVSMKKHRMSKPAEYPCIQCGSCVSACPMFLLPTRIVSHARVRDWEACEHIGAMACMECGSCVFACPSNIPLVQWIRIAKYKVTETQRKKVS